jgi:hypothetical protein
MGYTWVTKYVVLVVVALQVYVAYRLRNTSPLSGWFLILAYVVGGTLNHNLFLAIHEISHNLAFPGLKANRLLAMFANFPIGIPYAVTFKVNITVASALIYVMNWPSNIILSTTKILAKTVLTRIYRRG